MADSDLDTHFLKDLRQSQHIAREVCEDVFACLRPGLTSGEIAGLLAEAAQLRNAPLLMPAMVEIATETAGGILPHIPPRRRLREGDLINLSARPVVGNVAGDFRDTRIFGENGRWVQYRKLVRFTYESFLADLPSCRTEEEITTLAGHWAFSQGFELYHPTSGSICHPILPLRGNWRDQIGPREDLLVSRIKKLLPGKGRLFTGPWSVEPRFLIGEVGYVFHDVVRIDENGELERF